MQQRRGAAPSQGQGRDRAANKASITGTAAKAVMVTANNPDVCTANTNAVSRISKTYHGPAMACWTVRVRGPMVGMA